ncbi:uncharacterized protein MELLADRAFT_109855 [Melampsora larici-populina 98AG31]|uniref:Core-binding (CB) domain-containing protein n=1 Tax=Melampsora larici-populina (strain 98AG31 / pathotype 3-4-7) TaxID=747676 RepID=F4RXV0_MELLP|nr:uncharacterized protein MELLADRAFT_109855 [Melampsora larici-populina 98AG31]EGG02793.1 hypothetical protein MELLADRAFT_109855 [Melampsora larici-populina 98AG31]
MPKVAKNKATPLSFYDREDINKADLEKRLGPSSVAKYESGARRFVKFCADQNIPLWPDETALAHFVSLLSRDLQPSTINKYLTGKVHCLQEKFPFIVEARLSKRDRNSVQSCQKLFSDPIKRASPMSLADVHQTRLPWVDAMTTFLFQAQCETSVARRAKNFYNSKISLECLSGKMLCPAITDKNPGKLTSNIQPVPSFAHIK